MPAERKRRQCRFQSISIDGQNYPGTLGFGVSQTPVAALGSETRSVSMYNFERMEGCIATPVYTCVAVRAPVARTVASKLLARSERRTHGVGSRRCFACPCCKIYATIVFSSTVCFGVTIVVMRVCLCVLAKSQAAPMCRCMCLADLCAKSGCRASGGGPPRVYVTAVDRALGPQTERMNFDAPVMPREKKKKDTARSWSRDRLLGHAHIRACAEAGQHYLCVCVRVYVPTSGRNSCCRERHASSDG